MSSLLDWPFLSSLPIWCVVSDVNSREIVIDWKV